MKQLQENIRIVKVAIKLTAAIEDEEASGCKNDTF